MDTAQQTAGAVLGIALDRSSPAPRDLGQSTLERGGGDPSTPVRAGDEEARDPPIRPGAETLEGGAPVLGAGQLSRRPELAHDRAVAWTYLRTVGRL